MRRRRSSVRHAGLRARSALKSSNFSFTSARYGSGRTAFLPAAIARMAASSRGSCRCWSATTTISELPLSTPNSFTARSCSAFRPPGNVAVRWSTTSRGRPA
jgi:hypothetical protein